MSNNGNSEGFSLTRPFGMGDRSRTQASGTNDMSPSVVRVDDASPSSRGRERQRDGSSDPAPPVRCINPASDINSRLDTQVEVRVYPCNNSQGGGKKKFTTFTIKPEVSENDSLVSSLCSLVVVLPSSSVVGDANTLSFYLNTHRESLFKVPTEAAMPIRLI